MAVDKNKDQSAGAAELRRRAEERMDAQAAETRPPSSEAITQRLLHELQVHQIELEMQNEELRRARDKVETALEKYTEIYDFAPVGYFTLDCNGAVRSANLTTARIVGVERSRLIGRQFGQFIAYDTRPAFNAFLRKVFESRAKDACEVALLREGTDPCFVQIEAVADAAGEECRIALIDITERKQTEKSLQKSEERLQLFIEQAPAALAMFDTDMRYLSVSRRWRSDYSLSERHLIGESHYNVFPEITAEWREAHRRGLAGEVLRAEADRFERADGSVQWVRWEIRPWYDAAGKIGGIVIFADDITEIKKAEDILRRYELLAQHSRDIILFVRRNDGQILEANAAAVASYGYNYEELLGLTVKELRAPETMGMTAEQMDGADSRGILFETVHRRRDGSTFPVEVSSQGATIGGIRTLISIVRDISERKRAEEALHSSNEQLRLAQKAARIGSFDWNVQTGLNRWSLELEAMYGLETGAFGKTQPAWEGLVHPDDRTNAVSLVNQAFETGEPTEGEWRVVWPDGSVHWVFGRFQAFRDDAGIPLRLTGVNIEITERKKSEEAIKESEAKYRSLFQNMINGLGYHRIVTDRNGEPADSIFLEVNSAFERLTGLQGTEIIGKRVTEVFPGIENDPADWIGVYGRVALTGEEIRFENYSESLGKWFNISAFSPKKGNFVAIFEDITERKKTEDVFRFLGQCSSGDSGEGFFQQLARYLAQALNMDFVCIDRLEEGQLSAQTLAVFHNGEFEDDLSYTLKDTPCGDVVGQMICCFPENVRGLFPKDAVLQDLQAESYLGTTLWSSQGEPIGLIAVIGRQPMADTRLAESILQVVAVRAAGELERQQDEEELQKAHDELEHRVQERTIELASAVNTLHEETTERLRSVEELRVNEQLLMQQSRQAAMGEMIGNIAHQWRQPLNTLGLIIQELPINHELGTFTKENLDASVAKAIQVISHMSQTIDDFRNFFCPDKEMVTFKANDIVTKTVSLIDGSFREQKISIEVSAPEDIFIHGHPNEYSQVILNIMINARDAFVERSIPEPKSVLIRLYRENDRAVTTITDNAGGIGEEIMEKIFDPYFTTKGPDKGTGVGLFMSKTIIEKNMGGRLYAVNTGDGAEFRIEV